ncbi:MAG: molybdopterin-dependent oxidoreductase [Desulfobacterales bacterium]
MILWPSCTNNLKAGEKQAATVIEKTYWNSYVSHAPMEPHTAIADFDGKKLTVWASTQTPFRVKDEIAGELGLPADSVRVITPFQGGAFGGKSASRQALEAARLAKRLKKPVQVAWSRAEEIFFDTFRPAAIVKINSGLDSAGRITFWDYNVYFAGMRGSQQFYEIPHHREAVYGRWRGLAGGYHPFAVGPWRAPANNTNTYARDLHLNLMAARAGADPLQCRLAHLKDKRMISVLRAAAAKFGWQPIKTPSGRGYGIACGIDAGTYVAFMAEVEVDKGSGSVDVRRVVCAQDMGVVVNPEGATTQMEGCITMGLGYALSEEVHFSDGEIFDLNFDTYTLPAFSWLPKIETVILKNPGLPPQGGGEPAIIGMGGVIATAVHDAVGAAVFQLPMTPERIKAAIEQA